MPDKTIQVTTIKGNYVSMANSYKISLGDGQGCNGINTLNYTFKRSGKVSKQEIASLACKLLGIYLIIQGINVFVNVFYVDIMSPQQFLLNTITSLIVNFGVLILMGVLILLLSDKLSVIIVKKETDFQEDSGLKASDIQRVSFSIIGLLWLGNSIPKLVSVLVSYYGLSNISDASVRSSARLFGSLGAGGVIAQLVLGLWLFLGSQGIVNFLNGIRNAGINREKDLEDN